MHTHMYFITPWRILLVLRKELSNIQECANLTEQKISNHLLECYHTMFKILLSNDMMAYALEHNENH